MVWNTFLIKPGNEQSGRVVCATPPGTVLGRGLHGARDAEGAGMVSPSPPAPGWFHVGGGSRPHPGSSHLSLPPWVTLSHFGIWVTPVPPALEGAAAPGAWPWGADLAWHLLPAPGISSLHPASPCPAHSCCLWAHCPPLPGARRWPLTSEPPGQASSGSCRSPGLSCRLSLVNEHGGQWSGSAVVGLATLPASR